MNRCTAFISPLVITIFLLVSCNRSAGEINLLHLKVAVLPDQSLVGMQKKYQPLLQYLGTALGIKTTLIFPTSYQDFLTMFSEKKIDLALFGGVTYVIAHQKSHAQPLVMRDIDKTYRSVFLVKVDSGINSLKDLEGKTFSFGSHLSTTGHYMPRHFLKEKNIIPNTYFSKVEYSGAHDRTAQWVREGRVDVGVAHSGIINEMYHDGRLNKNNIKIIWETPSYPGYVWAVQNDLSASDKVKIRNAFMLLSYRNPIQRQILNNLGGGFYFGVHHDVFTALEKIVLN